jgi:hypothetical protein
MDAEPGACNANTVNERYQSLGVGDLRRFARFCNRLGLAPVHGDEVDALGARACGLCLSGVLSPDQLCEWLKTLVELHASANAVLVCSVLNRLGPLLEERAPSAMDQLCVSIAGLAADAPVTLASRHVVVAPALWLTRAQSSC